MAGQITVAEAEVLAQQIARLTARLDRQAKMCDALAARVEVLEDERARRHAEGGA